MKRCIRRLLQKLAFRFVKESEIIEPGMRRDRAMNLMIAMNDIDERFVAEAAEAFDLMEDPTPFADEDSIERIKGMTFRKIREQKNKGRSKQ